MALQNAPSTPGTLCFSFGHLSAQCGSASSALWRGSGDTTSPLLSIMETLPLPKPQPHA